MKAAAVFFSECYPTLHRHVTRSRHASGRVGYCAAYFHKRLSASQQSQLESRLEALKQFMAFYVRWMSQLIASLPPAMRGQDGAAGCLPQNDLFHAGLLDALLRVLQEPRTADCVQLQREIHHLILSPVPDARNMNRIVRGLGGGQTAPGPDGALASFLTALLQVVYDSD